jgi:hypothetical protein
MVDKFTNDRDRSRYVAELCNIDNLRGDCRPIVFENRLGGVSARLVKSETIDEMICRLKSTNPTES